jgi:hypothetical protein
MRRWGIALLACVFFTVTACGTILYPERRNQQAGRIDSDIVILDAIGLIFFFVPGVIAFAVDFATGAIYLPRGERSHVSEVLGAAPARDPQVILEHSDRLATWLSAQTGREVSIATSELIWFEGESCRNRITTCLAGWDALARSADTHLARAGRTPLQSAMLR